MRLLKTIIYCFGLGCGIFFNELALASRQVTDITWNVFFYNRTSNIYYLKISAIVNPIAGSCLNAKGLIGVSNHNNSTGKGSGTMIDSRTGDCSTTGANSGKIWHLVTVMVVNATNGYGFAEVQLTTPDPPDTAQCTVQLFDTSSNVHYTCSASATGGASGGVPSYTIYFFGP